MTKQKRGFTLIELLLVIAIIAILAAIVIIAINPGKQLADSRNSQRRSDVNTILNGVYQYSVDNNGAIPAEIPESATCATTATNEVCVNDGACTDLVELGELILEEEYLVSIPTDPTGATGDGAGYHIVKNTNGRITVCAPDAEEDETIEVTR